MTTEHERKLKLLSAIQTAMEDCLDTLHEDTPYDSISRSNEGIYWRAGAYAMFKKCEHIVYLKWVEEEKKCQKMQ